MHCECDLMKLVSLGTLPDAYTVLYCCLKYKIIKDSLKMINQNLTYFTGTFLAYFPSKNINRSVGVDLIKGKNSMKTA